MTASTMILPQACPECGVFLQTPTPDNVREYGPGVAPHFRVCHPGEAIPPVLTEAEAFR